MRQVHIVDDLGHQLVEALHQCHGAVAVTGHPEAAQHLLAELVGGGDGRGVEPGQRVVQAQSPLRPVGGDEVALQVVARPRRIVDGDQRADDLGAHPFA